jgi:predicted dehydrogenase
MKLSRRTFIGGAGASALFNIIPAKVLFGETAPSNQLTRALIGFGAIAHSKNHLTLKDSRLVGLTDCYAPRIEAGIAAAEKAGWGRIKGYKNFIELINDPGVDIVHICTPPHWHGVQSVMAANAGKDVWCEKPMTRTVGEGKRVKEVIQARKRMYRINTRYRFDFAQTFYRFGTSVEPLRQIVENGLLGTGPLKCVFGEGQGFSWKFGWSGRIHSQPQAVPKGLDWDMWLGPAPWKPYTDHRFGTSFRGYWDYDSGGLGDMAQHYLDPLQYLLCKDDTSPVKIEYKGLKQHPEAVGSFDRFTLTYDDGMEVILDGDVSLGEEPLLRGSNGLCVYKKAKDGKTLRIRDASGSWWSEEKVLKTLADLPKPAPQQTDFIDSCRRRKPFALNESNGFRSCTMFNLAIVAWRLGRGFEFDPITLHAKNDEAAERFLYQDDMMREPWRTEMFG